MKTIVDEIEKKYDLRQLKVNGISFWPYLRQVVHAYEVATTQNFVSSSSKIKRLFALFYGIQHLFKSNVSTIIFTDACLKKKLNEHYIDKSFDGIIEKVGAKSTLVIESLTDPYPKHRPKSKIQHKATMSYSFFRVLSFLISWVPFKKEGFEKLEKALEDSSVEIPVNYLSVSFVAQYRIMKWALKRWRPKQIFVTCYFGKIPVIVAAKQLGIKVIEVQHGAFAKDSIFYRINYPLDTLSFPDYLWTFGKKEVAFFSEPNMQLSKQHIIPIGNGYLEAISKTFKPQNDIQTKLSKFKRVIAVSGQDEGLEKKLIPFLEEISQKDPSIAMIYCPRKPKKYTFKGNIFQFDINVYEAICYSHFHTTIYSTCALESPSLGVRNIIVDIDNLGSKFFKDILTEETTTFVSTPDAFIDCAHRPGYNKNDIQKANEEQFAANYSENINAALKTSDI